MNSFSTNLRQPTVSEYLLLIEPRKDLSDVIIELKKTFSEKYKCAEAVKGKPHLTLVSFTQYEGFESRIRQRLRNIAMQTAPFSLELSGFGSFPSHTIFINVATKVLFQNLVKKIRTQVQDVMKMDKDHKPLFILEPHITLSRRLKPWQYEAGWQEYNHKNFSGKFIASEMALLKKEIEASKYTIVEKFGFQNIPVSASQAMLF